MSYLVEVTTRMTEKTGRGRLFFSYWATPNIPMSSDFERATRFHTRDEAAAMAEKLQKNYDRIAYASELKYRVVEERNS